MFANDRAVDATNLLPVKLMQPGSRIRDAFEVYAPGLDRDARWSQPVTGTGDLVIIDGNTASSSYLVISKDPWSPGTETVIESNHTVKSPARVSTGVSLSQRTQGQEASAQLVSTDTTNPPYAPVAIASISQAATTLSVTTAVAHGLTPGDRFYTSGVPDSRLSYPQLVVASTPTPTTLTATAGPSGAIPSVTAGPFTSGLVGRRPAFNYSRDGISLVFENATATQGSLYLRSEGGDAFPSGTVLGNHSIALATTASVAAVTAAGAYAFNSTSQYELCIQPDQAFLMDNAVDATASFFTTRLKRTQVVPNTRKDYKVRYRFANLPSMSAPVADIVSSTKAGTTTATVVCDRNHGLTTGDQVVIYGNRDQVNFANLTVATAVATVVNATTFTVAYGAAATATTYGGLVARINGGAALPGIVAQAVQTAQRTANVLTLVGSAAWSGFLIGDYVNVDGVRVDTTGVNLGVDGTYRVRDIQTTTATLEPIGTAPTGADIGLTNVGGAVTRRSDFRLHFLRVSEETFTGFRSDVGSAQTVAVAGTASVQGSSADNGTTVPNAVMAGGKGVSANPGAVTTGRLASLLSTLIGALVIHPWSIPEAEWTFAVPAPVTTAVSTVLKAAAGAGIRNYLTSIQFMNNSATGSEVQILDGATVIWRLFLPANMTTPWDIDFCSTLKSTANAALNVNVVTAGASVWFNGQGYIAP